MSAKKLMNESDLIRKNEWACVAVLVRVRGIARSLRFVVRGRCLRGAIMLGKVLACRFPACVCFLGPFPCGPGRCARVRLSSPQKTPFARDVVLWACDCGTRVRQATGAPT